VNDQLQRSGDGNALARGQATFVILKDYIAFRRNPASGLPTSATSDAAAQTRLSEYQRTQAMLNLATAAMADQIDTAASSMAFRQETLSRFISQPALDAYLAYAQVQSRSALTQADAFAQRTKALSAAAKQANVDMSVFGIELGKPLSLPPCPENMNGQPAETCRVSGFGFAALADQFAINGDFATVPGTANVSVKLGAAKCPDWIDCTLLVATKEGYALSVSFLTTGADGQDQIEARLSQKYHANPTSKNTYSECHVKYGGADLGSNARAANRIWTLTGLAVAYIPYGSASNCRQGGVRVATTGYGEVVEHANQEHEASQPKM
jgi:hypothetical protein